MAGGGKDRGELDPHGGEVQGLESTIPWHTKSKCSGSTAAAQAGLKVPSPGASQDASMLQGLSMIFLSS